MHESGYRERLVKYTENDNNQPLAMGVNLHPPNPRKLESITVRFKFPGVEIKVFKEIARVHGDFVNVGRTKDFFVGDVDEFFSVL